MFLVYVVLFCFVLFVHFIVYSFVCLSVYLLLFFFY